MDVPKTSLSAGEIIRDMLLSNELVKERTNKIFPISTDKAVLPYILYQRGALEHNPAKTAPGADTAVVNVYCYAATYAESVELSEAVRAALDYKQGEKDGLVMRSCMLVGAEEGYVDDAFVQHLEFNIKI